MKVLVTGASGFVGSWLTKYLLEQGLQVRILNRSSKKPEDLKDLNVEVIQGNVLDLESVLKAADGVDSIFHLAGVVAYTKAQRKIMDDVNIHGTENIIKACASKKIRRLVHFSSVVAIGASFDGKNIINETFVYNLKDLNLGYFESKHTAENLVCDAVKNKLIDAVIVNPSTIYGPGDAKKGSRGVQLKVAKGTFPFYPPGGVNIVSIEDVVAATYQAWKVGESGERYLLTGENILIKDLFDMIAEFAGVSAPKIPLSKNVLLGLGKVGDFMEKIGRKGPINSENAWASVMFHWYDNSKAKAALGLRPKSARYAVQQSVNWVKQNILAKS